MKNPILDLLSSDDDNDNEGSQEQSVAPSSLEPENNVSGTAMDSNPIVDLLSDQEAQSPTPESNPILDMLGVEDVPAQSTLDANGNPDQSAIDARVADVKAAQDVYVEENDWMDRIKQRVKRSFVSNRQASDLEEAAMYGEAVARRNSLDNEFSVDTGDRFGVSSLGLDAFNPFKAKENSIRMLDNVMDADLTNSYIESRNDLLENVSADAKVLQAIPQAPVVEKGMQAETFGELLDVFGLDPISFIAEVGMSSSVQSLESLAAGTVGGLTAGPAGAAAATGTVSARNDYQSQILGALGSSGVDVTNPEQVIAAFHDKEFMAQIKSEGARHAAVVGLVDGISMGIASKTIIASPSVAGKVANVGAQTVVGGALGGVGEAGGTLAAGKEINANEVFAEVVGEAVQAPAEVGVAALSGGKKDSVAETNPIVNDLVDDNSELSVEPEVAETREPIVNETEQFSENPEQGELDLVRPEIREQLNLLGEDIAPLSDLLPQITRQDKIDLDSVGFLEELSEFSSDDSNYMDAFDELTELTDLDAPPNAKGREVAESAPKSAFAENDRLAEDEAAMAEQIPYEGLFVPNSGTEQNQQQGELGLVNDQGDVQESFDLQPENGVAPEPEQQRLDLDEPLQPTKVDVNGTPRTISQDFENKTRPPEGQKEKRVDLDRRKMIANMKPEEVEAALYKNELTGIENRRSFEERVGSTQFIASIDADSLKAINDTLGPDAGDSLLKANAQALQEEFGNDSFHISGDEFYVLGDDKAAIEAGMKRVVQKLASAEIKSDKSDGSTITAKGLQATYAIDTDKTRADEGLKKTKIDREAAGKRTARGVVPNGVVKTLPDGTTQNLSGTAVADDTNSDIQSDTQNVANSESTSTEELATNENERITSETSRNGQERPGRSSQSGNPQPVRQGQDEVSGISQDNNRLPTDGQRTGQAADGRAQRDATESVAEGTQRPEPKSSERKLLEDQAEREAFDLKAEALSYESNKDFETALRDRTDPVEFKRLQDSGVLSTAKRRADAARARRPKGIQATAVKAEAIKAAKNESVVAVANQFELPAAVKEFHDNITRKTGRDMKAVYSNGKIYLLTDNLYSPTEVRQTVVHEAVHAGLSKKHGGSLGLIQPLTNLYEEIGGEKGMDALAEKYGVDLSSYKKFYEGDAFRNVALIDELVAHIAEKETGRARQLAIRVRKFMRKLLSSIGMPAKKSELETIDEAVQRTISEALEAFRSEDAASVETATSPYDNGKRGDHVSGMPRTAKVDGVEIEFTGLRSAQRAAAAYVNSVGMDYTPVTDYAPINKERAKLIAEEYANMKHDPSNPEVKEAYDALIKETYGQYQSMVDAGVEIEFAPGGNDPYGNPRNATLDVVNNNHLYVFSTAEGFGSGTMDVADNPLLQESPFTFNGEKTLANDIFRAVHDYYGHMKDGNGFRARGEEHAWRSHSTMYSPLARRAMTTETRGQNSWVNFGPNAEANSKANGAETVYADQKTGLLPEWISEDTMPDDSRASLATGNSIQADGPSKRRVNPVGIYAALLKENRAATKRKMKAMGKRWFTTSNNLPEEGFDLKLLADNTRNIDNRRVAVLNNRLRKGLKRIPTAKQDSAKAELNNYFSGSVEISEVHPKLRDIAKDMRTYLDAHSIEIAAIIQQSIDDQVQKLSNEAWAEYNEYMETEGQSGVIPQGLLNTLNLHGTIIGNIGKYLNRSFQAFDDPSWKAKVMADPELMENARTYIAKENPDFDSQQVDGAVIAILDEAQDAGDITGLISTGSVYGSKDVSIMKRKNTDIDPAILAILGEYKDPTLNFNRSAEKMSSFVANHHFLTNIKEAGIGEFFHDKPYVDTDGTEYTVKLASDGSTAMNPLNGIYTTREIRTAMKDFVDNPQFSDGMRLAMGLSGMVKYGKTILDLSVHVFNFVANFMFLMANGHFDPRVFPTATKVVWSDLVNSDNQEMTRYLERMLELGVIHDNPRSGELHDTVEEITNSHKPINSNRILNKIREAGNMALGGIEKLYQGEDDFFKVVAFESQLKKNIRAGMSKPDAEKHAAHRVRNGYPTYSMVPKAVVAIRQTPIVGSFPSFPYEVMRTGVNQFKFLAEDYQNDKRSFAVRVAGMLVASSALQMASVYSMMELGIDEDEDEAIKKLGPKWTRNSTLIYLGFDEDGNPKYSDVSRYDPYDYPKRIIRAGINYKDRGIVNMSDSAVWELLSPFFSFDILATAAYEAATNDRVGSSRPVSNDQDTMTEQVKDRFTNFMRSTAPGSAIKVDNIRRATEGETTFYGRKLKLADELLNFFGIRASTMDVDVSYGFKLSEFKFKKAATTGILTELVSNQNDFTEAEITDAFNRMMAAREKLYEDVIKLTEDAQGLGLTDKVRDERMKNLRISKADRLAIRQGVSAYWSIPKKYGESKRDAAMIGASAEDKAKLREIHRKKIRVIRRLMNEYRRRDK